MEALKENYKLKYVGSLGAETTLEDIFLEFYVNHLDGFMCHFIK